MAPKPPQPGKPYIQRNPGTVDAAAGEDPHRPGESEADQVSPLVCPVK